MAATAEPELAPEQEHWPPLLRTGLGIVAAAAVVSAAHTMFPKAAAEAEAEVEVAVAHRLL